MNPAVASLVALLPSIALSFSARVNVGVAALALAFARARRAGTAGGGDRRRFPLLAVPDAPSMTLVGALLCQLLALPFARL